MIFRKPRRARFWSSGHRMTAKSVVGNGGAGERYTKSVHCRFCTEAETIETPIPTAIRLTKEIRLTMLLLWCMANDSQKRLRLMALEPSPARTLSNLAEDI
jgi:hypothetical protein